METNQEGFMAGVNTPSQVSQVSGRYTYRYRNVKMELRLDVDGYYPQQAASGMVMNTSVNTRTDWVVPDLKSVAPNQWEGVIEHKDGDVNSFPYTSVVITLTNLSSPEAKVVFKAGEMEGLKATCKYKSPYFRSVKFEFDRDETATPVTSINTHARDDRPANLPNETLSIPTVFNRAGFDVQMNIQEDIVPILRSGADKVWSDMELHDTMQAYWSDYRDVPQWALWTFFASRHEMGYGLGGVMFDDIGPRHRQGTAIFTDSAFSEPESLEKPYAWITRNLFQTAVHEMGHAFNLAHSWQKSLGNKWPFAFNEPLEPSFMNYPHNYPGGVSGFFKKFEYRFSDQELLFMRHAPERYVQQGNAEWFENHGMERLEEENLRISEDSPFKLELRVNRSTPVFTFMEAIVPELKLTNVSSQPQIVDEHILSDFMRMTVVVAKNGKNTQSRQLRPFAQYCRQPRNKVLMPGESIYESLFLSAGANGWLIDEPGVYEARVALHLEHTDIASNSLRLRVAPPQNQTRYEEEFLAQDFFSNQVGRILNFDGSRLLESGLNALREISERLPTHVAAKHAQVALAKSFASNTRVLNAVQTPAGRELVFETASARPEEAQRYFTAALVQEKQESATTLGHIDYRNYVNDYTEFLARQGNTKEAAQVQEALYSTLSERGVTHKVLRSVKDRIEGYQGTTKETVTQI